MTNNEFGIMLACCAIWFIICLLACGVSNSNGYESGIETVRKEAVAVGTAEWVSNKEGSPEFKWKISPEEGSDN